jgi:hypothetical protein
MISVRIKSPGCGGFFIGMVLVLPVVCVSAELIYGVRTAISGKLAKFGGIESVDALDAVDVHGGEDLQIEDVGAGDRTPAKQTEDFFDRMGRHW